MTTPPSQSVFDALAAGSSKASWADRIKSVDKSTVPLPTVNATKPAPSTRSQPPASQSTTPSQPTQSVEHDDGEWQQVVKPVTRKQIPASSSTDAKQQGQSQGSASRDWRDRTDKTDEVNDKKAKAAKRVPGKKSSSDPSEADAAGETTVSAPAEASQTPTAGQASTPAPVTKTSAPAVNPWAARKEKMQSASTSTPAATKLNGVVKKASAVKTNGVAADSNKGMSSARKVGKGQGPPPVTDDGSWPDVAKAAEALKNAEKEKEKKAKADEASAAEAAANPGKKHKWTAISPLELQAAADKAAENARRQAKADQPRKKTSRNDHEAESSPSRPATRPSSRKPSISSPTKKGVKLPVQPNQKKGKDGKGSTPASELSEAEGGRRGSLSKASNAGSALGLDTATVEAGGSSLSKLTGGQSQPASPLAEPTVGETMEDKTKGTPATHTTFVNGRGGRGRQDGGRGYGGRGRGAYRNGHMPSGPRGVYTSPNFANGQLPADAAYGQEYGYAYGMAPGYGYGGAYPLQIGGRAMPPPPMPVTQVPGLDFLRICLLGQIEYYFGMQNLAMDFFLRQQMDSEGWIDISMISSFNRVKSLTPDVSLVRELMLLSSVLEVKDDFVRLSGGEAKRWVLPDAKLSTIQSDNEPIIENGGEAVLGVPEDDAHERWSTPNGGVESALLKSVPVSSSVSVDDSDAVKEDTPATSMSGDHDNREEMEMKTIGAAVDALSARQ